MCAPRSDVIREDGECAYLEALVSPPSDCMNRTFRLDRPPSNPAANPEKEIPTSFTNHR